MGMPELELLAAAVHFRVSNGDGSGPIVDTLQVANSSVAMDLLGVFRQLTLPGRCYLICGGEDFSLQVCTVLLVYWAVTGGEAVGFRP